MKLVIEIDDDMYKRVCDCEAYVLNDADDILLENAIANGTPLPKGHWINYKDEHRCSECNEVITGDWYEEYWYDFCPNCGADMRDKEREE